MVSGGRAGRISRQFKIDNGSVVERCARSGAKFFSENPGLEVQVIFHYALDHQTLKHYPGTVSEAEMHSLENLRGIPYDINPNVHLRLIRREWNRF